MEAENQNKQHMMAVKIQNIYLVALMC